MTKLALNVFVSKISGNLTYFHSSWYHRSKKINQYTDFPTKITNFFVTFLYFSHIFLICWQGVCRLVGCLLPLIINEKITNTRRATSFVFDLFWWWRLMSSAATRNIIITVFESSSIVMLELLLYEPDQVWSTLDKFKLSIWSSSLGLIFQKIQ